ncbi:MAG: hypothetical protein GY940_10825, partial [bacterium]|nr:hypothetical protein [bacterium]
MDENKIRNAAEAKDHIAHQLKDSFKNSGFRGPNQVLRFEAGIQHTGMLEWLAAQTNPVKLYFSGRDPDDHQMAGIGAADTVHVPELPDYPQTFEHFRKYLSPGQRDLSYYGGFAFAPGHIDTKWEPFAACHFILPRFELYRHQDNLYLACNVLPHKEAPGWLDNILSELEQLNFSGYRDFHKPGRCISRTDIPGYNKWQKILTDTIGDIDCNQYTKVVLARKVLLDFEEQLDPVTFLWLLKQLPSRRY